MKRKTRKQITRPPALVERTLPHRRFIAFPEVQGRTVSKIELFTTHAYHSITIDFDDKTAFTFIIEPCFLLGAELSEIKAGNQDTISEWPAVHSQTEL